MKKYTLEDIKKLPCMKMEEELVSELFEGNGQLYISKMVRNQHRHQLLEEMKEVDRGSIGG